MTHLRLVEKPAAPARPPGPRRIEVRISVRDVREPFGRSRGFRISDRATGIARRRRTDGGAAAMIDHAEIKRIAETLNRPAKTLVVLSEASDPFFADRPARRQKAEWAADVFQRMGGPATLLGAALDTLIDGCVA